jgi:hypothetical protein
MAELEVQGLRETQEKMEQMVADLQGPPMVENMSEATLLVTRDAKILAPVDTGRLRASILPRVTVKKFPPGVEGVVGSRVEYAPFQEERKGFLREALEKNARRIRELFGRFVARIVRR